MKKKIVFFMCILSLMSCTNELEQVPGLVTKQKVEENSEEDYDFSSVLRLTSWDDAAQLVHDMQSGTYTELRDLYSQFPFYSQDIVSNIIYDSLMTVYESAYPELFDDEQENMADADIRSHFAQQFQTNLSVYSNLLYYGPDPDDAQDTLFVPTADIDYSTLFNDDNMLIVGDLLYKLYPDGYAIFSLSNYAAYDSCQTIAAIAQVPMAQDGIVADGDDEFAPTLPETHIYPAYVGNLLKNQQYQQKSSNGKYKMKVIVKAKEHYTRFYNRHDFHAIVRVKNYRKCCGSYCFKRMQTTGTFNHSYLVVEADNTINTYSTPLIINDYRSNYDFGYDPRTFLREVNIADFGFRNISTTISNGKVSVTINFQAQENY